MKGKSSYFLIILVLFLNTTNLFGAAEPNDQEVQLAQEKMQRLREAYREFYTAAEHLLKVTEQAKREVPLLCEMAEALEKIEDFKEHGLAKDQVKYREYLNNSKDIKATKKLFSECRSAFGARESAKAIGDPNQAKLLKIPIVAYFRAWMSDPNERTQFIENLYEHPSFSVFDVNDPDDERLWQNLKVIYFKQAEQAKVRQRELIEQKGVPEWLADYAGKENFAQGMYTAYSHGLYLLTPEEVRQAEKQLKEAIRKMGKIYPGWFEMRHLLTDETSPDKETIIHEAYEHMQLWPSVYRK